MTMSLGYTERIQTLRDTLKDVRGILLLLFRKPLNLLNG